MSTPAIHSERPKSNPFLRTISKGKKAKLLLSCFAILLSGGAQAMHGQAALGDYPDEMVLVGGNTTVTPDAPPTNTTSINVFTESDFKGVLVADPTTGVVSVTNAHPAGAYTVMVTAFSGVDMAIKTFTLTAVSGPLCDGPIGFTNAADISGSLSNPFGVATGDFNNDGKQDFAIANRGAGLSTVSIRLGDGSGGFSGTTNVPVGSFPSVRGHRRFQ